MPAKHLAIHTADDIVPVSEFKAQVAEWLRKVAATDSPVVVTQNGRAAGILLSPSAYDALTEQARFVEAVQAGLDDAEAGRVHATDVVLARLRQRSGQSKP
jgi:prevent-host-death family protein